MFPILKSCISDELINNMSYKIGKVNTNECRMPYISFGTGNKALVILPGISIKSVVSSAPAIEKQYELFCRDFTVYLFERRENMPDNYSVCDMAKDTVNAINELGLCDICLFGVSQGGMIAMIIAAEYTELVSRLALGSSAAAVTEKSNAVFNEWLSYAEKGEAKKLCLSFGEKVYPYDVFKQYKEALAYMAKTVDKNDLQRFITLVKGTEGFDACEKMRSIKCPVLAVGDTEDKVLGADSTRRIAGLQKDNPRFEMFMYSGFGHAAYDTAPDYTQRLYNFFNN